MLCRSKGGGKVGLHLSKQRPSSHFHPSPPPAPQPARSVPTSSLQTPASSPSDPVSPLHRPHALHASYSGPRERQFRLFPEPQTRKFIGETYCSILDHTCNQAAMEIHGTPRNNPNFFWKGSMFSLRVVDLDFEGPFWLMAKGRKSLVCVIVIKLLSHKISSIVRSSDIIDFFLQFHVSFPPSSALSFQRPQFCHFFSPLLTSLFFFLYSVAFSRGPRIIFFPRRPMKMKLIPFFELQMTFPSFLQFYS